MRKGICTCRADSKGRFIACSRMASMKPTRAISGSRAGSRSIVTACCMSAIDRERCSRCSRIGSVNTIATLPASVAAFHLAIGPDDCVYVTAPTLGPYDYVYRIDPQSGSIDKVYSGFGRPQGIAFDSQGALYVVEALAGWNGLYRVRPDGSAELIVSGQSLVGVAFNPNGGLVVASNDTAYGSTCRFDRSPSTRLAKATARCAQQDSGVLHLFPGLIAPLHVDLRIGIVSCSLRSCRTTRSRRSSRPSEPATAP